MPVIYGDTVGGEGSRVEKKENGKNVVWGGV